MDINEILEAEQEFIKKSITNTVLPEHLDGCENLIENLAKNHKDDIHPDAINYITSCLRRAIERRRNAFGSVLPIPAFTDLLQKAFNNNEDPVHSLDDTR